MSKSKFVFCEAETVVRFYKDVNSCSQRLQTSAKTSVSFGTNRYGVTIGAVIFFIGCVIDHFLYILCEFFLFNNVSYNLTRIST